MPSLTIQNNACLSLRQIQYTDIFYTSLHSVRSETQRHFSYRPSLVTVLHCKYLFAALRRIFNDTLLYRKPAYHHSCWLTQRCQMYQAKDKTSKAFAVTKEQQLSSQSLLQRCKPERPHCVLVEWEQRVRRE
jgi:hypothetical protein